MLRIAKIPKFYKMVKMVRLVRMLKAFKEKDKLTKYIKNILKIDVAFDRLFFFLIIFLLLVHIGACSWLYIASMYSFGPETWIGRKGY